MGRLVPIPGVDLEAYFPLAPGEKRPFNAEVGWFGHHPTRSLTPENYQEYEQAGADWGMRCGTFSGLVVIDADSDKAVKQLRQLGLRSTCFANTKRGQHHIFKVTTEQLAGIKTSIRLWPDVDVISTGNMVRVYKLVKPRAPPDMTAAQAGMIANRIKEKHGNGAGTWVGGDIEAGERNATLNASLYQLAVDNPELELRHYKLVADGLRSHMDGPMADKEFQRTCASAWNAARTGSPGEPDPFPAPLGRTEFVKYVDALPPRVSFLGPLLSSQVGIMYAPAGVGKSMLAMFIADSVATGSDFGPWTGSGQRRRCLIVDGEMDARDLGERLELLPSAASTVDFSMSELWPTGGLNLTEPESQAQLLTWARDYDLVIVDNISALVLPPEGSNIDIWSPTLWQSTAPLRAWFRKHNKHLLWIDHSNAGGGLQGTMAKQRDVDYLMALKRPEDQPAYLEFDLTWPKYRGRPRAGDTRRSTWSLLKGGLDGKIQRTSREKVQQWKAENPDGKQVSAAKALGMRPQAVSKYW